MRGPFERRCAEITDKTAQTICLKPVSSSISDHGHESMWCDTGHPIKRWYVVDAEGVQVALAKLNSSPEILDAEMLESLRSDPLYRSLNANMYPPKPNRLCKRGHNDWFMNPDERYRCRQCKRERYEVQKKKARDRYRAKPQYKVNQMAKQVKKLTKALAKDFAKEVAIKGRKKKNV